MKIIVIILLFGMYGCFACVYICAPCVCNVFGSQKRMLDLLGLGLQMVVRIHADVGGPNPDPTAVITVATTSILPLGSL